MMSKQRVTNANHRIFRKCREQIGLSIEQAQKKASIKTLDQIEKGEVEPTFRQLENLADLYHVPQWVFLRDKLPDEYDFSQHMPSFRQFSDSSPVFADHQVRVITASVEQFRELILELRIDMEESIEPFSPPPVGSNISNLAQSARKWLGCTKHAYSFECWKKAFEDKGIFVFLTSKYSNWSKVDPFLFRGFSIYKDTLPIIVINDSDARAAQSFTLLHELGHLFRKESAVDAGDLPYLEQRTETWCDKFAGEVLMPGGVFVQKVQRVEITGQTSEDIANIDRIAKTFKVSSHACAVRMLQLGKINQWQYGEIKEYLEKRYKELKEKRRKETNKMRRNIAREKLRQYGSIYSTTIVQAYRDQEIGLHKLCKLFGIRKVTDAVELEGLL